HLSDERVYRDQRSRIPFQAALVLVLFQVLRRRLAKRVLLTSPKEFRRPCRLKSAHQERPGFLEIACASAFANARSVDDFVDVPDTASKDESGHSSTASSHGLLLPAAGRPFRRLCSSAQASRSRRS